MMSLRCFLLATLALAPTPALAQAACAIPADLPAPRPERPDGPRRTGPIGGYMLALSWSPEFCRAAGGRPDSRVQCASGNRFGFVLHGLWPEFAGPRWPQWCRPVGLVPPAVVRANICATPSPQLIQHEWAKHGSCMSDSPLRYFRAATRLYRAVRYPDMPMLAFQPLTVGHFAQAFATANPGLDPSAIRVQASRTGWLQEVRICLGRDLRPRRCPTHARGARPNAPLRIWRTG